MNLKFEFRNIFSQYSITGCLIPDAKFTNKNFI